MLNLEEKNGGATRNLEHVINFKDALSDCGLKDLRWKSYPFIWSNKRFGPQLVEERLNRFLYNDRWKIMFKDVSVVHMESWTSDHCPIMMERKRDRVAAEERNKRTKRFYYEDLWSNYKECKEIVKQSWCTNNS